MREDRSRSMAAASAADQKFPGIPEDELVEGGQGVVVPVDRVNIKKMACYVYIVRV
jgi:hypothetical protein